MEPFPPDHPAPPKTWAPFHAPLSAALYMVAAAVFFAGLSAVIRYLAQETSLHPFEIAFFRNLFGFVFMLPWLARVGLSGLKTRRLFLYAWRSALGLSSMLCWFTALKMLPFAEAVALSFATPLFATVGAALVLHERVRARRWTATVVGFIGVLVIVRPGAVAFDLGAVLVIASTAISAGVTLIVKNLTRTEHPDAIATYMVLLMTPLSLVPALFVWDWPALSVWPWLAAMGALGSFGHMCFLRSFALAEASAVMPYDYTRLIFSAAIGYLAFAEIPDPLTWVGGGIIAAAAVYIARRESQLHRVAGGAAPPTGSAPAP